MNMFVFLVEWYYWLFCGTWNFIVDISLRPLSLFICLYIPEQKQKKIYIGNIKKMVAKSVCSCLISIYTRYISLYAIGYIYTLHRHECFCFSFWLFNLNLYTMYTWINHLMRWIIPPNYIQILVMIILCLPAAIQHSWNA